jgi:hypothetical protein
LSGESALHSENAGPQGIPTPEAGVYALHGYEAPLGEIETTVAAIWADLLRFDRVGRNDNFFELEATPCWR